jgi:hypothetical protein
LRKLTKIYSPDGGDHVNVMFPSLKNHRFFGDCLTITSMLTYISHVLQTQRSQRTQESLRNYLSISLPEQQEQREQRGKRGSAHQWPGRGSPVTVLI